MKSLFRIALTLFLLLLPLLPLQAGPGIPWEQLLNRYEQICKKSLEIKKLREEGQDVSPVLMRNLLSELESLKTQLKGISDKMPAGARRRFDAIKEMYTAGVFTDTTIGQLLLPGRQPITAKAFSERSPVMHTKFPATVGGAPHTHLSWTLSASVMAIPDFAAGAMLSCSGRKVGGYAAFRSNFSSRPTSYEALSDGSSGDSRIWASGKSASDCLFITAGPVVPLTKTVSIFGGAGYGHSKLFWEDTDGLWMKISDASPSGLCTELGAMFSFSRLCISACWIGIPFSYGSAALSVGYRF